MLWWQRAQRRAGRGMWGGSDDESDTDSLDSETGSDGERLPRDDAAAAAAAAPSADVPVYGTCSLLLFVSCLSFVRFANVCDISCRDADDPLALYKESSEEAEAARESRLPPDAASDQERLVRHSSSLFLSLCLSVCLTLTQALPALTAHPRLSLYLRLRNALLRLWRRNVHVYLTVTEARRQLARLAVGADVEAVYGYLLYSGMRERERVCVCHQRRSSICRQSETES
jgi:hypothetical protein